MKNVLLINGAKAFGHSSAKLSSSLHKVAYDTLIENGFKVEQTIVDEGYESKTEIEKIIRADIIVYQLQGFWMNAPWIVWKYFAKVFKEGAGVLFANDGRSRSDASKNTAQADYLKVKNTCFHGLGMHLRKHLLIKINFLVE